MAGWAGNGWMCVMEVWSVGINAMKAWHMHVCLGVRTVVAVLRALRRDFCGVMKIESVRCI